ncbi:hypothetical protein [Tenacibaculum xiamenense]|uniref:hypothetical protein n=1 Tax=Tenacibaculum xiamenense TaxID=1261553 RepID=UPI003893F2C7
MKNKERINEISKRELKNEEEIKTFISDLKGAGASLKMSMDLLNEKKGMGLKAYWVIKDSGCWPELHNNPFTQEFLDIAAESEDAIEVIKENRVVSGVKLDVRNIKGY